MCGILGAVGKGALRNIDYAMRLLAHRGPDDSRVYKRDSSSLALGATRLAIQDISGGRQPYSIDDGQFVCVLNGEIFNAPKLRQKLENLGEVFSSVGSDTELVCRLFKYYGLNGISMLRGMFACCVYDLKREQLTLFRDYWGIKPLFYSSCDNTFAFSSEINSCRALTDLGLSIPRSSLRAYLALGYIPHSEQMLTNINSLYPGQFVTVSLSTLKIERGYWADEGCDLIQEARTDSKIGIDPAQFGEVLDEAIAAWSAGDAEVLYSLSSGIDSSVIAAIASGRKKIPTISVRFGDQYLAWDESREARRFAAKIGAEHHEIAFELDQLEADFPKIIQSFGAPFAGGLPSYYLYKGVKELGFKVVMTGVGGDEVFGNYHYANLQPISTVSTQYSNHQSLKFDADDYIFTTKLNGYRQPNQPLVNDSFGSDYRIPPAYSLKAWDNARSVGAVQFDMAYTLPNDYLYLTDMLSMHWSVEARTPFLDPKVVKFALGLGENIKLTQRYKKPLIDILLKKGLKSTDQFAKKGFNAPISFLMRNNLGALFDRLMGSKSMFQTILKDDTYVRYILPFLKGDNSNIEIVWRIFVLQYWLIEKNLQVGD